MLPQVTRVSGYICYDEENVNLLVTGTFYSVGPLLVRPSNVILLLFILKIIYFDSTLGVLLATTLNRIVRRFHTALTEFTVSLCRKPRERFHSRGE